MPRKLKIRFRVEKGNAKGTGPFIIKGWSRKKPDFFEVDLTGAFAADPVTYAVMVAASKGIPREDRDHPRTWPEMQYQVEDDGTITNIVVISRPQTGSELSGESGLPT